MHARASMPNHVGGADIFKNIMVTLIGIILLVGYK